MKTIDFHTALRRLHACEDVLILTHANPDGDTLGSGYALFWGLQRLGKRVRLLNNDPLPEKYQFLARGLENGSFAEQYIICVDVADTPVRSFICCCCRWECRSTKRWQTAFIPPFPQIRAVSAIPTPPHAPTALRPI